jgi:hypothetical protein
MLCYFVFLSGIITENCHFSAYTVKIANPWLKALNLPNLLKNNKLGRFLKIGTEIIVV